MTLPDQPDAENAQLPTDFSRWTLPALNNCWYLTGPTSSGKTALALEIAGRADAEIISLDSMAVYRGMDIGTAKPSLEQRSRIVHHLIDVVEPTVSYSVSSYVQAAHQVAAEIHGRGKRVLICGGTPLYLKSLIRGLFLGPEADWDFRDTIERDISQFGEEALRERLSQVDPLLAHRLHPHDHRRMIRGLEVARITGTPLSHWQQQFEVPASPDQCPVVVLRLERQWLHERINARVVRMIQSGLADEVAGLLRKHQRLGRTAAQAVGYREMIDFLDGKFSLEQTTELIRAHTRQFARRQEIWFRGLNELQAVEVRPQRSIEELATEAMTVFSSISQEEA